ncbi:MAG: hypothetical protein ACRDYU_02185 [Actinomycetes bacterium]
MGIGACILLLAVGAIIVFATDLEGSAGQFDALGMSFGGIDLEAVGIILMVVGALGLVVTTLIFRPRSGARPSESRVPRRPY